MSPLEKDNARTLLLEWLDEHPDSRLLVRVNGVGTEWHEKDIQACTHSGIVGIVFPKAEDVSDISRIWQATQKPILPIIETAKGIDELKSISIAIGISRLLFGKLDLAVELNINPDEEDPEELVFLNFRSLIVVASKLAGLPPPVDGVFTAIENVEGLRRYSNRAKNHGFGAILLIHPKQVDIVTHAFTPSANELAWARKVIAASDSSGGGTVSVDGKMVDAPVIHRARRILEI